MKRLKFTYGLLVFALLFLACNSKQSDENLTDSKYCSNEISLFSTQDSLHKITIDYKLDSDSIINSIENILNKDLCWNIVNFGLVLTNNKPVKVHLLKECNDGIIRCFRRFPEVNILLNQKGLLLIENDIIQIDSVKFWIHKNFPNDEEFDFEEISIKWTTETPKDSIEKTFENIIDGYLMNYSDISQKLFSKNICDLSKNQVDSLKTKLPFKIRLGMGRQMIPPPPPPPINGNK